MERMLLQLQTTQMFFRPRIVSAISSVTASMLISPGAVTLLSAASAHDTASVLKMMGFSCLGHDITEGTG